MTDIRKATYRIPERIIQAVDLIAGRQGRSRNHLVAIALEQYVSRNSKAAPVHALTPKPRTPKGLHPNDEHTHPTTAENRG